MTFEEEWECDSVLSERRSTTSHGKLTRVLDFRFDPGTHFNHSTKRSQEGFDGI